VLSAATDVVFFDCMNREPEFLRLALKALRVHRMANALALGVRSRSLLLPTGSLLLLGAFWLFSALFLLASPALIAAALSAAARGQGGEATVVLYIIAIGSLMLIGLRTYERAQSQRTQNEQEFDVWSRFESHWGWTDRWTLVGAGATTYLEDAVRRGADIPPLALDICALLSARVSSPPGSTHATKRDAGDE
jgi:hypothetical protein